MATARMPNPRPGDKARKSIPRLLDLIVAGTVKPERVLRQREPMNAAIEAYRAFDLRRPRWLKVELSPEVH